MNKRIQELSEQAVGYAEDSDGPFDEAYTEKFAELIVKECARIAWIHTPDTEELEYSHFIKDKIKEHFGIGSTT